MNEELLKDNVFVSTDKSLLNLNFIISFLKNSYWSPGIPLEILKKAIDHSLCFGIYENLRQVGFARVITDKATFAYLADVFIDPEFRGKGYSKILLSYIMNFSELQGLRRFLLATRDAHGLYTKFGFTPVTNITPWMQIHNPDIYQVK